MTSTPTALGTGAAGHLDFEIRSLSPALGRRLGSHHARSGTAYPAGVSLKVSCERLVAAVTPRFDLEAVKVAHAELFAEVDGADRAALDEAVSVLGDALATIPNDYEAGGILAITCGGLVENGASTLPAATILLTVLPKVLMAASRFQNAVLNRLPEDYEPDEELPEDQMEEVGDTLVPKELVRAQAHREPRDGAAFASLERWSLPMIACLTRDREVRALARSTRKLNKRAHAAVGYRGFLTIALDILDDEPLVVLHPSTMQGYELTFSGVCSNFDLHVLLADRLSSQRGGPDTGLAVTRPDPDAVRRAEGGDVEGSPSVTGVWNLHDWRAIGPGPTLPTPNDSEFWIWNEGRPSDIPRLGEHRIVVLGPPSYERNWGATQTFSDLCSTMTLDRSMDAAEVRGWIDRISAAPRDKE